MIPQYNKVSPIYLLPSMFTLGAMFCGFFAIIQSITASHIINNDDNFVICGLAIFIAMILDSLDGRVARLTRTASGFGEQLDSLADMVSFGIAPAVIVFNWKLYTLGKYGWLIAFLYCACTSLRLARFNNMLDNNTHDKKWFIGLPSPSAAALVVGFVYISNIYHLTGKLLLIGIASITLIAALSMVSNIKFYSFKELTFYHRGRFRVLLLFLLLLALVLIAYNIVIYSFFVLYALVSYFNYIFRIGYGKKNSSKQPHINDNKELANPN
jgi:CDP-diacylglycerol--serine O-phosphatidyltransferase